MSSISNRVPLQNFVDPYMTLLEQVRAEGKKSYQNDANIVPLYYRGPVISLQPIHISEIKPLPLLPSTLSPAKDQSRIPPRAFYGFQLALSDAVRILKKVRYLEYASFPADVSDKEAFLEDYITTLFPAFVDRYIKFLHKELDMKLIGFIPTFFADVLGDDKEIILFTISDSWRSQPFLAPIIIARLAHFLEKDVTKEDLPYYYLAAHGDGLWRKPSDMFFWTKIQEARSGERPIAMK